MFQTGSVKPSLSNTKALGVRGNRYDLDELKSTTFIGTKGAGKRRNLSSRIDFMSEKKRILLEYRRRSNMSEEESSRTKTSKKKKTYKGTWAPV